MAKFAKLCQHLSTFIKITRSKRVLSIFKKKSCFQTSLEHRREKNAFERHGQLAGGPLLLNRAAATKIEGYVGTPLSRRKSARKCTHQACKEASETRSNSDGCEIPWPKERNPPSPPGVVQPENPIFHRKTYAIRFSTSAKKLKIHRIPEDSPNVNKFLAFVSSSTT